MTIIPVFGRPNPPVVKTDVFDLMSINQEMNNIYVNHVKKLDKKLNLNIQRADDIYSPKPFMEKVWDGIFVAELIVADRTQQNPNVFYEIGIAHTIGKSNSDYTCCGFLAGYICAVFIGNQELMRKKKILKSFDSFAWLM